jgi:hypothetical protein
MGNYGLVLGVGNYYGSILALRSFYIARSWLPRGKILRLCSVRLPGQYRCITADG